MTTATKVNCLTPPHHWYINEEGLAHCINCPATKDYSNRKFFEDFRKNFTEDLKLVAIKGGKHGQIK